MVLHRDQEQAAWTPRRLRDPAEQALRRKLLIAPHVAPLTNYVADLRRRPGCEVPDFDPCDGGADAILLFLFEKPGPMTSTEDGAGRGSGFISRDNDDPTAEATGRFMLSAGIPRNTVVLWTAIPWWNGKIKIGSAERRAGLEEIRALLQLLPRLRVVVLVGRMAELAEQVVCDRGLPVFRSAHPAARVRARFPERLAMIPDHWRQAYARAATA